MEKKKLNSKKKGYGKDINRIELESKGKRCSKLLDNFGNKRFINKKNKSFFSSFNSEKGIEASMLGILELVNVFVSKKSTCLIEHLKVLRFTPIDIQF